FSAEILKLCRDRHSAALTPYLFVHFGLLSQFYGGSVRQNFRRTLRELSRIVSHSDYCVCPDLICVHYHPIKCLAPSLFANHRPFLDISANDGFQSTNESSPDPRRTHNDPAYNATVFSHQLSFNFVPGCYDHF